MRPSVQPSIDLLETFVTLIGFGGDAAQAARALDINQPSMSKRLAFLQHANGVLKRPWLRRSGKTWHLTEEGHRLLPGIQDLLYRYQFLNRYTNAPGEDPATVLRFACGQTAGAFLMRRFLKRFVTGHPSAQIRISTMRTEARIAAVASGAIDMALVSRDNTSIVEMGRGTQLRIAPVGRSGYCLACASGSRWSAKFKTLARNKPLPLSALGEFPMIVPEADSHTRKILDPFIRRQSWAKKVEYRIEIGGWLTIIDYVRAGLGVGLVSELAAADPSAKNLLFRPLTRAPLGATPMKVITRAADEKAQDPSQTRLRDAWRASLKAFVAR